MTTKQSISLTSAEFIDNPYPFYDEMRSMGPLYKLDSFPYPGWYVTGYEEVKKVLLDTRFKNRIPLPLTSKKYERLKEVQNHMMLFKNELDHRRLRGLASAAFVPSKLKHIRYYIEETAHDLLNQAEQKNKMDVVSDYAFPLASLVIAKMIGVPVVERPLFREWSASLIRTIDFTRTRHILASGDETIGVLLDYFQRLINKKKRAPKDDLISMFVKQDSELSEKELLATCILLMIAGHETTVNLISNTVLVLLNHPVQYKALQENPALIETAIEEVLRYESPTQMTARVASEDIKMGESIVQKGDHVYVLLGAANRDPEKFAKADVFDMTRKPNPHLAFGHGVHFCIGASLARMEAQIAIQILLQRMPGLRLSDSKPRWRKLIGFRSLSELPVILRS
ncbi:cytochrome P450 [Siminovitchia sp. FSL H7-0308]|uniref:Pimeloyl-[acyl-carrier protein] synthase n=1 Tax=Siminovitchia thermophila TaxID=1245522 RepID=A0ABS2R0N6_9BACI|nr:cytochrome P450 [Siminovitchia thermophila]MBM7713177.1 pimeloyl-[acyl-carrier protein] synthase [Siminovitchia thermophila]ONK24800.1 cytochrome [Bacillus sp. VT-16-64]